MMKMQMSSSKYYIYIVTKRGESDSGAGDSGAGDNGAGDSGIFENEVFQITAEGGESR